MTTVSAVKLIQPGEIQSMPADDTPLLVYPNVADLYKDRSTRFAQLAKDHDLADWLQFCAQLTAAQATAISEIDAGEVLEENFVRESLKHGVPPLSVSTWKAGEDWQKALQAFITAYEKQEVQEPVKKVFAEFKKADAAELAKQAQAYLTLDEAEVKPEWAPFIGAVLQLIWSKRAAAMTHAKIYSGENSLCPVCGSHPVTSVVRVGDRDSHRYLICSLCSSEWYGPRARCTNCDTPKEVTMLGETRESLVQGECCDDCGGYLILMFQSRDPMMDPVADDLATIQLDMALEKEGFQRTGRNLFLMAIAQSEKTDT